jgi:hypothetical protein
MCVAVTRLHVTGRSDEHSIGLALVELDEGPLVMGRTSDDTLVPGCAADIEFRPDGPNASLIPCFSRRTYPR